MSGLFQGLEIGKRALLTHQLSMNTIGHNLANVGTPGYTRQRVKVATAMPWETAQFNIGNGVVVTDIEHIRDNFLTTQYRRENKSLGEWTNKEKTTAQIEAILNEPGDNALSNVMSRFWDAWLDLSNEPESTGARDQLVAETELLVDSFHQLDTQLRTLRDTANKDVVGMVKRINLYAREIANLNRLIVGEELGNQKANDLRDSRDLLIDELSQLVDVTTQEFPNGSTSVYISGLAIVDNADVFELDTRVNPSGKMVVNDIVWKNTTTTIKVRGGELKGLLDTRDSIVPDYMEKLDNMAASLVEQVNAVHRTGTGLNGLTNLDFFNSSFTTAATIRLESGIESDPQSIGASLSGKPGDNANALAIHAIRHQLILSGGSATIDEYYNAMIGSIGVEALEAKTYKGNFETLLQQIENSRQSVQGVSLDEEMANMVRMQHAYNAAARSITTIDEALGTVIQGMGVVGR